MNNRNKLSNKDLFSTGEKTPFIISATELENITELINCSIKNIESADNPRTVILEAWIVLDYFIRSFIISGLNLDRYSYENFDLKFKLLPQGFKACLNFLETFIKNQKKLKSNPNYHRVDFYGDFAYFILKNHKEFYKKQFLPIVEEYYKKYYPELLDEVAYKNENFRAVSDEWMKIALIFNDNWFKKAMKINETRNLAAHSFDSKKIYFGLGINGRDKLSKTKSFCKDQLMSLLDIKLEI